MLKSEEEIREFIEKISLYVVGVLIRIEWYKFDGEVNDTYRNEKKMRE